VNGIIPTIVADPPLA